MTERPRAADEFGTIAEHMRRIATERNAALAGTPPRKTGTAMSHCDHCPHTPSEACHKTCAAEADARGIKYEES